MPQVKLENKTAKLLHISLGGAKQLAIPPTEGGITVDFSDAEAEAFKKNLATPEVQGWIEAGDLVLTDAEPEPKADEDDEPEDDLEDDEEV